MKIQFNKSLASSFNFFFLLSLKLVGNLHEMFHNGQPLTLFSIFGKIFGAAARPTNQTVSRRARHFRLRIFFFFCYLLFWFRPNCQNRMHCQINFDLTAMFERMETFVRRQHVCWRCIWDTRRCCRWKWGTKLEAASDDEVARP